MSIKDVKREFIEKGRKVLNYELDTAIGETPELHGGMIDKTTHPKIVNTMLELIKADTDIQKIKVKNTADVLEAISKGELSVYEAKEVVALLSLIAGDSDVPQEEANKIIIEIATGNQRQETKEK